ncbi:MAG TPA: transposase [Verrucomicrobiota bacterium]|nr:transposase [Verrucomicrobiota bacterium]HQB15858.1 transposase [Verrucomicrobiota bacterium]
MSQRPYVLRTWAPRGQTPLLRHPGGWKKLSAAAGVTRRGFSFRRYPGSIQARQLIHFLGHLKRQLRGKILLVWDRLGVHRRRAVRDWLARQGLRQAQRRKATLVAAFWKQADLHF